MEIYKYTDSALQENRIGWFEVAPEVLTTAAMRTIFAAGRVISVDEAGGGYIAVAIASPDFEPVPKGCGTPRYDAVFSVSERVAPGEAVEGLSIKVTFTRAKE